MRVDEVVEWYQIAEDDLYSAKVLNDQVRKPIEIICYHCAQSAEKILKGFLVYNDVEPPKTHNLLLLHELCVKIDNNFTNVRLECGMLNKFANEIRYPHWFDVSQSDADLSIKSVEKIKNLKPIKEIINNLNLGL